ncbi:alpha/beta fold hydrolase [Curtobacterium ammoniigenes]|uniref:alpha/beta fold hydrolase n=1 Tax=Curtobacterium ammoniigenes TaxID=395387 RepID=UPI00082C36AD|nr:alpha/beta hydrolase [Curtobacterium ammoniigenes]
MATDLPVYDHQPGTGPTVVFLHYWGGSARTWAPVRELLPRAATLSIDFRGWARSHMLEGPYTLDQYARDVLAILAAEEVHDFVLVGHSMGGKVAQLIAAAKPEGLRGVVLVGSGPAVPAAEITPEYRNGLAHAYDSDESVAFARDTILTASPLRAALREQILEDSRSAAEGARTEWPLRGIAADISASTREIDVPALVIAGENDGVEPVDVLRTNLLPYLASAEFVVIPSTGHLIPLEASAELAALIGRFVAQESPNR